MDSAPNVTWEQKLWDVIRFIYWTPRFVGMRSITDDKFPADFKGLKSLKGEGYRLYQRNRKIDAALKDLSEQEEVLNFFFNIAFAIAPDEVLSRLFCTPLDITDDPGPFTSLGGGEIAYRYRFGNDNVTQPDAFFMTSKSLVAVEMKLRSVSWPEQIAKYIALMRWEQEETGRRENLGLLFIVPEKSLESNWSKAGLNDLNRRDDPAQSSMFRRCPADFFDNLNQRKLPDTVLQLFKNRAEDIRSDFKRLRLAAVSWTWLKHEISKIEGELDCSFRGDQTLKRLLAGFRTQIEAHRNTGIVETASAAAP